MENVCRDLINGAKNQNLRVKVSKEEEAEHLPRANIIRIFLEASCASLPLSLVIKKCQIIKPELDIIFTLTLKM